MVNYRIGHDNGSCYDHITDTIELCIMDNISMFTDNELIAYVSDSIIHEFLHSILQKHFNRAVSQLYDGISDNFRNMDVTNKLLDHSTYLTHPQYIKKYGFEEWTHFYGLTQDRISNAKKLCCSIIQKDN